MRPTHRTGELGVTLSPLIQFIVGAAAPHCLFISFAVAAATGRVHDGGGGVLSVTVAAVGNHLSCMGGSKGKVG